MASSASPPLTSFTIAAPAASARSATLARIVSMLTVRPAPASAVTTQDPPQLLRLVDPDRARAGRFAADVHDVGPGRRQLQAVGDRLVGAEPAAAVGERVGRDVDDAHDQAPIRGRQTRRALALTWH